MTPTVRGLARRTTARGLARRIFAPIFVLLTATGAVATMAPAAHATTARMSARESSFATMINRERARHGLRPLLVVSDLTYVARVWSAHMAAARALSHNPRLTQLGGNWTMLAENVGEGPETGGLEQAFMASLHHRENMLNPSYTEIGIGVLYSRGLFYVTEDFRRPVRAGVLALPPYPVRTATSLATQLVVHPVTAARAVTATAPASSASGLSAPSVPALSELLRRWWALTPASYADPVASASGFVRTMTALTAA